MSAFIVPKAHIDALVRSAVLPGPYGFHQGLFHYSHVGETHYASIHEGEPDRLGRMLLLENVRSVAYRYKEEMELPAYSYSTPTRTPSVVEGLKLIHCYEYQSCEHPDWPESEAYAFCEALTKALICALPGYEEAPWAWEG